MAQPVFTSYAQADRDDALAKFMEKFQRTLGGYQAADPITWQTLSFFDKNLRGGERWEPAILLAVRQAKVLVCLVSHIYLRRPWCGRELQVFLDRVKDHAQAGGAKAEYIFPIWWMKPPKPRPLPAKLAQFNFPDPEYAPDYPDTCVWDFAQVEDWVSFNKMAVGLARLVHTALENPSQLPHGAAVAKVEEVLNAFDEQVDFDSRLLVLMPNGADWQPGSTDQTVRAAAEKAERALVLYIRPVEQSGGLAAGLEKAQAERQIILLVVEAKLPPSAELELVNGLVLPSLAVLLVETGTPLGADAWLASTGLPLGSLAAAKGAGLFRVAGPGALEAEMQLLLEGSGQALRAGSDHAKAVDPQRAELARTKDGVNPDVQSHLTGVTASPPR